MTSSLVGSEMCIRDRSNGTTEAVRREKKMVATSLARTGARWRTTSEAVSYTHLTLPTICSV
eukprot:8703635-Prorocentrum_lima.AAC.1